MLIRIFTVILVVIFLFGCATTKNRDIQIQELQGRINYLETELQSKSQEISYLESELGRVQYSSVTSSKQKEIQLSVKQIQKALKNAGFYNGPIDGKIGPKTKEAIKAFQKANGLKPDGIAGKKTEAELNKYLGR